MGTSNEVDYQNKGGESMEQKRKSNEVLKKLRGKKSTGEVASALGISESAYIKYERGERDPRDPVKRKIAEYYNRSVAFIFYS